MASVRSGRLVYASTGLLTDRPATTHCASLNLLSEIDPTIRTDVAARFVDESDLLTCAGASAGIDMALHLVARFGGAERAREVRRGVQSTRTRPSEPIAQDCPDQLPSRHLERARTREGPGQPADATESTCQPVKPE